MRRLWLSLRTLFHRTWYLVLAMLLGSLLMSSLIVQLLVRVEKLSFCTVFPYIFISVFMTVSLLSAA
ncbi:EnvZ, partial [Xenorhabdus bovienii]|nr:EnvZ [Xenorhabdus bovienii]